ncbi:MAG TPA: FecR domain-containing protein [Tepidisphaeraceae bacterium]|nr:FecR domain-containing protein [Tepidisphaeraceae bacterium]
MECEDAINLVSAEIDGELPADERSRLDAHLAGCAGCRATAEAMRLQDAQLVRTFVPRRKAAADLAGRVVMQLAQSRPRPSRWLWPLASAAAGFLLAVMLLRPWQGKASSGEPGDNRIASIGRLDIATGLIECRAPGGTWSPMQTGAAVAPGSRVRTGPGVRCEFAMDDGSEIRVNENSEIALNQSRRLDLATGQVFSVVAKAQSPFELAVAGATVTALGTRFDVQRRPDQVVLAVLDGSTRLASPGADQVVQQGQIVSLANGRVTPLEGPQALDQATRWITDILVLKGRDNPELNTRIDDLFAQIGEDKMAYLRENELKAFGDRCVVPLTRYLESPRSTGQTFKCQEAARIVGDVAQPWCIPDLIQLLQNPDGQVRAAAAQALFRLTGQTQNRSIEQWRDQAAESGKPALEAWQAWWQENRDRYYPTADRSRADHPPPAPQPAAQTQGT